MKTILVRRSGALGDVIDTTPVIARLRAENPDAIIDMVTHYEAVYRPNLDVNNTRPNLYRKYDRIIDLDGAFERLLRKVHPIDAYSEVAFGDRKTPHLLKFAFRPASAALLALIGPRPIVIHPCRNWPIRTLPLEWWQRVVDLLLASGFNIIVTGTSQDHDGLRNVIDLRDKLTLAEQAGLIDAAHCFLCSESGPMVLAQVTRTPIIALLTMTPLEPDLILHERAGGYGWRFDRVQAAIPCAGCSGELDHPITYLECRYGHGDCVRSFDAEAIADLVATRAVEPLHVKAA